MSVMILRSVLRLPLIVMLLVSFHTRPGLADDWAELMPLVESSLLLGVDADDSRIIVVGERGHVLLSNDRGAKWQQIEVPTRRTLTAVRIVEGRHAWAVGHDGLILHSDDGGLSWSRQHVSDEPDRPLLDIWFADAQRGIAIGAYGLLLSTDDGGRTWRDDSSSDDGLHANAIVEAPDRTLYIVGELGSILRSDDRGKSWQQLASPYQGSLFGLLALDNGAVVVFGLRGHVFRSEDRGRTWQRIASGTTATLLTGLVRTDGRVMIAGLTGALLSSNDGGRTFEVQNRPDRHGIAAIVELGLGRLLAVGDGGLMRMDSQSLVGKTSAMLEDR